MTDALSAFHFLRPWWLLLLAPAFALWLLERRDSDSLARWRDAIDPVLLRHLTVGGNGRRRVTPGDALLAGWIVAILAIAGPAWRLEPSPFGQPPPAMLVLKVTPSMLTTDLQPTRLDRARQKISDLLKLREGAATGLVAYAGSAHLVLPPTTDGDVVNSMAQALAPDVMPSDGDSLGEAIRLAVRTLADAGQGGSVLVLADVAAPDQIAASAEREHPPLVFFAMAPPDADDSLEAASAARGATFVPLSIDNSDVSRIAYRLAAEGASPSESGAAPRWREAGYWLSPLVALLALVWFRRGWALS